MKLNNKQSRPHNFTIQTSFLFLLFRLIPFILLFTHCNITEPNGKPALLLQAEDASCIEAWLKVKTNNVILPAQLNLFLNDSLKQTIELTKTDTVIYDEGLLPNKTYKYNVTIKPNGQIGEEIKSEPVTVKTLDTTSHNFTWQIFTFGGVNGSSYLKDVAIINENDIWAVGEIHTAETDMFDSNGVWVQPYNAVHWNGEEWELIRIGGYGYWAYSSVFAFSENDVWFDGTVQWNGEKYMSHMNDFPLESNGDAWRINAMWGTSNKDFYIVGNGGNIAHYNGSSWTKIESGIELDIRDIYGSFASNTGEVELLCIASNKYFNEGSEVIQIKENQAIKLSKSGLPWSLSNIWFIKNRKYLIAGDGLYISLGLGDAWKEEKGSPLLYKNAVRGTSLNNIVVSGAYGLLSHYNGLAWHHYIYAELPYLSGSYDAVDINDKIIATVGYQDSKAIIVIGKR